MRKHILVTIALAVFGALVLAATAGAKRQDDGLLDTSSAGVEVNLPEGQELPEVEGLTECSNEADDDEDGKLDADDPECQTPLDNSEQEPGLQPLEDDPPIDGGGEDTPDDGDDPGSGGSGGRGGGDGQGNGGNGSGNGGGNGGGNSGGGQDTPDQPEGTTNRNPDGSPAPTNPGLTVADFGAAPIGVPNFVIDQFTIPPFLLPIYQACGTEYGIPWQVLASINRIETAFGTNLNVSTAGALGWMQFMPATWEAYGVDANDDGRKDPYNPVDAICAAARYLNAAGGEEDLRTAIFAYNRADWYVDEVLLYARQYGKLPDDLVGSLTGLTEGAHFPVAADARYADDISERAAAQRSKTGRKALGNAADVVSSSPTRRGINIYSRKDAPVVAVNDGVIRKVGKTKELGRFVILEDAYGNRYTYAGLGTVSEVYPVPKQRDPADVEIRSEDESKPDAPASRTDDDASNGSGRERASARGTAAEPVNTEDMRERLYAYPERPENIGRADITGQLDALLADRFPGYESFRDYLGGTLEYDSKTMEMRPLREGSKVVGGTVIGRLADSGDVAPHLNFAIRPAGRGAPKIDPKPILDGWKLLEATAIYRAAGKDPFSGSAASTGQILLMSKEQLGRRVLANPRVELSSCDRDYVRGGVIDRRLLASFEYLAAQGFRLTVTSLYCGRESSITSSGNVSQHSTASAADIAAINGQPVLGNQGPGTLAQALVEELLQLQGTMLPDQVISLMDLGGPSFSMSDHDDHVHYGYAPTSGPASRSQKQLVQLLKPDQWERLIGRLAKIDNPRVSAAPSRYSLPARNRKGASRADVGE